MEEHVRGSVLVVDDEPTIAEVVSRFLERAGYRTRIAEDGARALELVADRRTRSPPRTRAASTCGCRLHCDSASGRPRRWPIRVWANGYAVSQSAVMRCRFRPYVDGGRVTQVYAVFRFAFRIY